VVTSSRVRQLRAVLLVDDLDAALRYYRDALGLRESMALAGPDGARVTVLEAGRATLELGNAAQGRFIDGVEAGGQTGTAVRLAFEVDDAGTVTDALAARGARVLGAPARTPWGSLNARLDGPAGVQTTVFQEFAAEGGPAGWASERPAAGRPSGADGGSDAGPAAVAAAALVGTRLDALGGEAGVLATTVDLADRHGAQGGLPFAALVVQDGVVVGAGVNETVATRDPSAHGEVAAIRDTCRRTASTALDGAVVYSSCEPCSICRAVAATADVAAIVWAADATLVPALIAGDPERAARLAAAVSSVVPDLARRGATALDETALAAPFRSFLAATS
jgi:pyrimidine deaminase RibD-like protein/predicted enzyme related to lactoylglutathione lyase